MNNDELQVQYIMQVYNDYVDFPIVTINIEQFDFEKLSSHPNPRVREFNCIVISRCTTRKKCMTVQPVMVIYNKKDWEVKYEWINDLHGFTMKTGCSNRKQNLDFDGCLIKFPCDSQSETISRFNFVSKILIAKSNVKNKVFTLLK